MGRSYRRTVRVLREFEGWRCLWRVILGAAMFLAVTLGPLIGMVAGVYLCATLEPVAVVVGCVVTLASGAIGRAVRHRKPWRTIVEHRLWTFEAPAPATELSVLVPSDQDVESLYRAFRRAHFNPSSTLLLGTPPDDAPDLRLQVPVQEPETWKQSSSDVDRVKRVATVLQGTGLRGRVSGRDVFGGNPAVEYAAAPRGSN